MNVRQKHISKALGIPQPMVGMILAGKDIVAWKNATPEEFRRAFNQYTMEKVA